MTLDEFRRLAETWGGDIARWPESARAQAEALATTADAAAILAQARAIDRMAEICAPEIEQRRIDDAIHAVVTRIAGETPRRTFGASLRLRWLAPSAGFAGALALGMVIGLFDLPGIETAQDDMHTVLTMLFDNSFPQQDWLVR